MRQLFRYRIFRWVLSFLLFIPLFGTAQGNRPPSAVTPPPSGDNHINILWADEFTYAIVGFDTLQKLVGNVELNQDTVFIYCDSALIWNNTRVSAKGDFVLQHGRSTNIFADSATYRSDTKIAELYRDVSMVRQHQKLFTDRLTYDANTKIATYFTGATLTDDTTHLTSKKGYYHSDTDDIFFKDSVVVVSPDFSLKTDTLQFNAVTKLATFHAPTLITQDTAKIYTESGYYDIENKLAEFTKKPQYLKNDQKAWAKVMRYNGNLEEVTLLGDAHFEDSLSVATADVIRHRSKTEVTVLEGRAFFKDRERDIRGDSIAYDAKNETYSTRGRSRIVDGAQILDADRVDYVKERELGIAEGNVIWQDTTEKLTVVAEFAEHSKKRNYLKASGGKTGRPLLIKIVDNDSLFISADTLMSIQPDSAVGSRQSAVRSPQPAAGSPQSAVGSLAVGSPIGNRAALPKQDSLNISPPPAPQSPPPIAEKPTATALIDELFGNDSAAHISPKSQIPNPKSEDELIGKDTAVHIPPKSEIPNPKPDDELFGKDSTSLIPQITDTTGVAKNPKSEIKNPKSEDSRIILAFHDVRIFKKDLQAVCDSLSYSTLDSMFRLFEKPVVWSDTSQFTSDTVLIQLAHEKIDRIFLRENSFIVNSPDEVFFNQIKGKNSTAFFEEGDVRRVRVEGNAESVYYPRDDNEAYIGVNKTICSEMLILFGNNEVEGIRFYTEPKANIIPMKKADHEAMKMPGFSWQTERRPKSVEDLTATKKLQ